MCVIAYNGAMGKGKTLRYDGTRGQIEMAKLARMPKLAWPDEATRFTDPKERALANSVFDKVLLSRAPTDWSPADVLLIADYAFNYVMLQRCLVALEKSGPLVRTAGGNNFKQNPLYKAIENHERSMKIASQRLGINIRAHMKLETAASRGAEYRRHVGEVVHVENSSVQAPKALKGLIQ